MIVQLRRVAAALGFLLLGAAPNVNYAPYLTRQDLVDIGHGRRLNLYCTGGGTPTVILDTDQDSSIVNWRFVQPVIAKKTRVCSYDAAGLGFSDPAAAPRDATAYMMDLHALLERAHVKAPYILVGYGFSGMSARLFADAHPREVAGMVLVDPMVPYRNKRLAALVPALSALADERGFIASLRMCRDAAMAGKLQAGTQQFKACMWPTGPTDPALPVAVRHVLQRQWQRPAAWDDLIFAAEAEEKTSAEVMREQMRYGNMPLIVLTSDTRADLQGAPLSATQLEKIARAYQSWHRNIAELSRHGKEVLVPGATADNFVVEHAVDIIAAIDEVVRETRRI